MVRITTNTVKKARQYPTQSYASRLGREANEIYAHDDYDGSVLTELTDPLILALHTAFADHQGVVITPDIIYTIILNGPAQHIQQNGEKLRPQFVSHEGQREIIVEEQGIIDIQALGQRNLQPAETEELQRCMAEFRAKVGENGSELTRSITDVSFSTSTPDTATAISMAVMSAFQSYFTYTMFTRCGIAFIDLRGTVEDWTQLREKVQAIRAVDQICEHWSDRLLKHLDEFVRAAAGQADASYWCNIYKWTNNRGSGVPGFITGWITDFYLYIYEDGPHSGFVTHLDHPDPRRTTSNFPQTVASCPVVWKHLPTNTMLHLRVHSGLMGVEWHPEENVLIPHLGWALAPDTKTALSTQA